MIARICPETTEKVRRRSANGSMLAFLAGRVRDGSTAVVPTLTAAMAAICGACREPLRIRPEIDAAVSHGLEASVEWPGEACLLSGSALVRSVVRVFHRSCRTILLEFRVEHGNRLAG